MFEFREIWPTENRLNRALFTGQKISPASQTVTTARIAPKSSRASPQQCTQSPLHFIQIGLLTAEF